MARDIFWDVLARFVSLSTQFLQHFIESENEQKTENMMSCTILYVESIEDQDVPMKETKTSNPYKEVMREREGRE